MILPGFWKVRCQPRVHADSHRQSAAVDEPIIRSYQTVSKNLTSKQRDLSQPSGFRPLEQTAYQLQNKRIHLSLEHFVNLRIVLAFQF